MTTPHTCERCETMPRACKGALLDRATRAEKLYADSGSVRGWYWKKRADRLADLYNYSQQRASRMQLRADRMESRVIKAERALRQYEMFAPRRRAGVLGGIGNEARAWLQRRASTRESRQARP